MKTLFAIFSMCCTAIFLPVLLAQETYGQPEAPLVAEVLGTDIHTTDVVEMKYVIRGRLLDRYAAERGIEVSQADIDTYIDAMQRVRVQDRQQRTEQRAELVQQLAAIAPEDPRREALSAQLETLDQLAAGLDDPAGDAAEEHAARETVAAAFMRHWKINRALYRQYGGRIIFQQGGPEPLDAYREFLQDQQRQGAFRILDKSVESEFLRYYVTDSLHSFYTAGSQEEAEAFETPWWLQESPLHSR